jgi:predicted lipoprotein with Yx(FWY)xxD motif
MSVQQTNSYLGGAPPAASSTAPPALGSTAPASSVPLVTTRTSKLGTILVDGHGQTLYTLVKGIHPLPCTGSCWSNWTPLTLPPGRTLTAGPGVIGIAKAASGQTITDWGFPLFRFSGDQAPGDTNGNNIKYGSGVWRVIPAAPPKSCAPLVAPVVHRLERGDSIVFQGGPVALTYLAGSAESRKYTFTPAKGNTLRATAGPLMVRMEPASAPPGTTVCTVPSLGER